MAFLVRIVEGDEDGHTIYDTLSSVAPRKGETMTFRWPNRDLTQYIVTRVDHLIDVKLKSFDVTDDLVALRVYVRLISPPPVID
ncbi:hypothetical protein [uncultured Sphingomonas sp.]|uniref:hypothetical protein n=1 Tax=uncultured Sphingomonas sp. TaxID=158754 RepID=UPI00258FD621|nr:hypothetical protein [uncultured Sphingomonas sp.]